MNLKILWIKSPYLRGNQGSTIDRGGKNIKCGVFVKQDYLNPDENNKSGGEVKVLGKKCYDKLLYININQNQDITYTTVFERRGHRRKI